MLKSRIPVVSKGLKSDCPGFSAACTVSVSKIVSQLNCMTMKIIRTRKTMLQNVPWMKSVSMIASCPPQMANVTPSEMTKRSKHT